MERAGPRTVPAGTGMRSKQAGAMAILPVGAPGPRRKTRAKLVEAEPKGISGPGFESPHLHQFQSRCFPRILSQASR